MAKKENWMDEKRKMELRLTNDFGGTMVIKTKCSTNDLLDLMFHFMADGWYLDTPEMIKREKKKA